MQGHDEVRELLAAYALDAVDDAERDVVDAHVAQCVDCRAELASLRSDVAAIDASVVTPDGLWTKVVQGFRRRTR